MLNQFLRLWIHIEVKRRIQFGFLMVLMIFVSLAEVVSIGAVIPFLGVLTAPEKIFENELTKPLILLLDISEPKEALLPLTIFFGFAAVLAGVLRIALVWIQARLSYDLGAELSIDMYNRTLFQPYGMHISRNSSEVISGIVNKANSVVGNSISPVLTIISSTVMLVTILAALLTINTPVTLVSFFGFGLIYLFVVFATKRRIEEDGVVISLEYSRVVKTLQEGLGGIRDILIDNSQAVYVKTYRDAEVSLRRALANVFIISVTPRFAVEAIGMVFIAVLAYSLTVGTGNVFEVIPVLGALALAVQRLLPILQQAYVAWTAIRGGRAVLDDALSLLEQPLPKLLDRSEIGCVTFRDEIALDNVSFQYEAAGNFVLKDFSLKIKKGQVIGFIGQTGSGKSTVLDIIMALINPTTGCLMVDGSPINSDHLRRGWQAHLAHVPQSIFLSDTSVAQNIAFGIPSDRIDYARVAWAAKQAKLSELIEAWPSKYETNVGERGVNISGGQRQRIGIARALYKKTDVIVFDEATSALDSETERNVMDSINNLPSGITVLIVAHRLSTLEKCDAIFEIADGKVKRAESYSELLGDKV
jgi:ABC-type multidrug transport system fused ATPase/permease subunit